MKLIETIFNFVPESYRSRAYIVGGFACNPLLAGDIDIWITKCTLEDITELQNMFGPQGLAAEEYKELLIFERHDALPGLNLQVFSARTSILEVMSGFDVSTHCIAISLEKEYVFGEFFTDTKVEPKMLTHNINNGTPSRMTKISERYAKERV